MGQALYIISQICMIKVWEPLCCCCVAQDVPYKADQLTAEYFTFVFRENGMLNSKSRVASVKCEPFAVGKGLMSSMLRVRLKYELVGGELKEEEEKKAAAVIAPKMTDEKRRPPSLTRKIISDGDLKEEEAVVGCTKRLPLPHSMVVKITPPGLKPRLIGELLNVFRTEVEFFQRDIASKVDIDVPACYHAATNGYGRYIICLEDLSPATSGDQMEGVSFKDAKVALAQIAKLHSKYRGKLGRNLEEKEEKSDKDDGFDWLLRMDDAPYYGLIRDTYIKALANFDQNLRKLNAIDCVDEHFKSCAADIAAGWNGYFMEILAPERQLIKSTLLHGDFRLENMFFNAHGPEGKEDGYKLVDFQLVKEGAAELDLSFFISGSYKTDVRRKHEEESLKHYYKTITESGLVSPREYTWGDLIQNYMAGAQNLITILVILLNDTPAGSEKVSRFQRTVLSRATAWLKDWDIHQFLVQRKRHYSVERRCLTKKFSSDDLSRLAVPKWVHDGK